MRDFLLMYPLDFINWMSFYTVLFIVGLFGFFTWLVTHFSRKEQGRKVKLSVELKEEEMRYHKAASEFYTAPMGLNYSIINGYHDVAVTDLARVIQKEVENTIATRKAKGLL